MDLRALDALLRERSHFGLKVIAHEVKLMNVILIRRMERGLAGRESEDQPTFADIYEPEVEKSRKNARSAGGSLL